MPLDKKTIKETVLSLFDGGKYAITSEDLSAVLGNTLISSANILSRNCRQWGLGKASVGAYPLDTKAAYFKVDGDRAKIMSAVEEIRQKNEYRYKEKLRKQKQRQREDSLLRRLQKVKECASGGCFDSSFMRDKNLIENDARGWLRMIHEREKKPLSAWRIKELYCEIAGKKSKGSDKWFEIIEERDRAIEEGEYEYENGCTFPKAI